MAVARVIRRGDVHLVRLDPTLGSEIRKTRPCLVISPDEPVNLLIGASKLPDAKRRWARLVEIQAAGFNQDDHHGNKYTGTNPGGLLRYLGHTRSRTALGPAWEVRQTGGGLIISSHFQFLGKLPACRT